MEITEEVKAKILKQYSTGNQQVKTALEEIYGKDFFINHSFYQIKSYLDACEHQCLDAEANLPYPDPKSIEDEISNLQRMALTVAKSINILDDNFQADFSNSSQEKWFPFYEMDEKSCFGFSDANCVDTYASSHVGSRFCYFASNEAAEHYGKTIVEIATKLITLK